MFNILKNNHYVPRKDIVNVEEIFTSFILLRGPKEIVTINSTHDCVEDFEEIIDLGSREKLEKLEHGFYVIRYSFQGTFCSYHNEGDIYFTLLSITPTDLYAKNNAIPQEGK